MTERSVRDAPPGRAAVIGGVIVLALFGLIAVGLVALAVIGHERGAGVAAVTPDPAGFAYAEARPAPALELTDQDGVPFALASLRGRPVLVFFGYTHCPDVCPVTVGLVSQALDQAGPAPRAVFVSIDPERDDVAAMKNYIRYLPAAFFGLSGAPQDVRRNADAWGIKYARIDQELGRRLRHGAHRGRVPRGRPGTPPGALPVRDGRGVDGRGA